MHNTSDNKFPTKIKYIFVTGGVVSSLGKGVAAASLGALLQSRGYTVHSRKFDPYLNPTSGNLDPQQHGEVYVTNDGHETDLDLGYYERFLGIQMTKNDSVSGGRVYWNVLNRALQGYYQGDTIQTVPHITNEIQDFMGTPTGTDFVICEIGGTVGDIEGEVFLEAARQFANKIGRKNVMFTHLTLAPYIAAADEMKTKPTQASVKDLLGRGIQADMLIVRAPRMLTNEEREKIALFCNIAPNNVISGIDAKNIYEIPLIYEEQNVFECMATYFNLDNTTRDLSKFITIKDYLNREKQSVKIAVCGKYFDVKDSYKSLNEALFHAGIKNNVHVDILKIDSDTLVGMDNAQMSDVFRGADGILIPGTFGNAINGKMNAIKYARENQIPILGIGIGMIGMVMEFLNGVVHKNSSTTDDFASCCCPKSCENAGLKLGGNICAIHPDSIAYKIYGTDNISERHRHRMELDITHGDILQENGMIISAKSNNGQTPEMIEVPSHPFFVGCQFHPEFGSSPYTSHPLFAAFINAAIKHMGQRA